MTQLLLTLDFCCWNCDNALEIKVHCCGKGLAAGPRTVAAVELGCPHCTKGNQVCFHPTGTVVCVRPAATLYRRRMPSLN